MALARDGRGFARPGACPRTARESAFGVKRGRGSTFCDTTRIGLLNPRLVLYRIAGVQEEKALLRLGTDWYLPLGATPIWRQLLQQVAEAAPGGIVPGGVAVC